MMVFLTFSNAYLLTFNPHCWSHSKDGCSYKGSVFWIIYSVVASISYALICWYFTEDLSFNTSKMPVFVNSLTNVLALGYLSSFFLEFLNKNVLHEIVAELNKLDKYNIFCEKSRKMSWEFQVTVIILNLLALLIQNVMFFTANYVFDMEIPLNVLVYRNFLMLPIMRFMHWLSAIRYLMSMFVCFENSFINYLGYRNIHPSESVTFTHNTYDFAGFSFTNRKVCQENHFLPVNLQHLSKPQIIDYLRITHEKMYCTFLLLQKYCSPQMLIYTLYELAILIIVSYSMALHIYYKFEGRTVKLMFLFNLLYTLLHGIGLFWFFKILDTANTIMQELRPIIMTCALNAKSGEEQQQLRIFAKKVVNQKQFAMSGFFNINMGVIGPVLGTVITYVFVALQLGVHSGE